MIAATLLLLAVTVGGRCGNAGGRRLYFRQGLFILKVMPVIGLYRLAPTAPISGVVHLPLVGVFIMLVWLGAEVAGTLAQRAECPDGGSSVCAGRVSCHNLVSSPHLQNDLTLFRHALAVTTRNAIAHNNLGLALDDLGQTNEALAEFNKALEHLAQL